MSSLILYNSNYWLRVQLSMHHVVQPAMLYTLHNDGNDIKYKGMPRNKSQLYAEISALKLSHSKDFKVLKPDQLEIMLPSNGSNETDSSKFDTTITYFLIRKGTNLPKPRGGWKTPLPPMCGDDKRSYACFQAKKKRNEFAHAHNMSMKTQEFEDTWNDIIDIVTELGCYPNYEQLMKDLKSAPLEPHISNIYKIIQKELAYLQTDFTQLKCDNETLRNDLVITKSQLQQVNIEKLENMLQDFKDLDNTVDGIKSQLDEKIDRCELEEKASKNDLYLIKSELEKKICDHTPSPKRKSIEDLNMPDGNSLKKDTVIRTYKDNNGHTIMKVLANGKDTNLKLQISSTMNEYDITELQKNQDYTVERIGQYLFVRLFKQVPIQLYDLNMTMLDVEGNCKEMKLEESLHDCTLSTRDTTFTVSSHTSEEFNELIDRVKNVPYSNKPIAYQSSGNSHTTYLSRDEWKLLGQRYTKTFFTKEFNNILSEALQFPPYVRNSEVSEWAYRIKTTMSGYREGVVAVITDYNTLEHIQFLKFETKGMPKLIQSNYTKRILFMYLNSNIMFNIRYTNSSCFLQVQKEFENGEKDIQLLSIANSSFILTGDITFVNVVLAENFVKSDYSYFCKDCHLLDKNINESDDKIKKFFCNLIAQYEQISKRVSKDEVTKRFMEVISSIVSFMATRKSMFPLLPTLNKDTGHQVRSIMLNKEQMDILHSKETKKIIVGDYGTGKTLLGIYHLKYLAERAEKDTLIFHITWDSKSLLVYDVESFVQNIQHNEHVGIVAISIIELATRLSLNKLPSLSQLLKEMVKTYKGLLLHVVIDECDCGRLSVKQAQELKSTLSMKELDRSHIIILPQSLEKRRTHISFKKRTVHDQYQYKETGMGVFTLHHCMRTTLQNFKVIHRLENVVEGKKNISHHPKMVKDTIKRQKSLTQRLSPFLERKSFSDEADEVFTFDKKVVNASSSPGRTKEIQLPLDIDSNVPPKLTDSNIKTETMYHYRTSSVIGHNIQGEIPIIFSFEDGEKTNSEIIILLAITLNAFKFSNHNVNRLILCESTFCQLIMKYVLHLLDVDTITYNSISNWKLQCINGNEIESLPASNDFTLLTNYQGARGREADEVILCMEDDNLTPKHLMLECLSRSTSRICIVFFNKRKSIASSSSFLNLFKAKERSKSSSNDLLNLSRNEENDLLKKICIKSVSGNITDSLYVEGKEDGEIKVNKGARRFKNFYACLDALLRDVCFDEPEQDQVHYMLYRKLQQPIQVKHLVCTYMNENTSMLAWTNEGFDYALQKRKFKENKEYSNWCEVPVLFDGNCRMEDLEYGSTYQFSVVAYSNVGVAKPTVLTYKHEIPGEKKFDDIRDFLQYGDVAQMTDVLRSQPNIIKERGYRGDTPLLYAADCQSVSMVQLLLDHGSCVFEVNDNKETAYHVSAINGHAAILETLLHHSCSAINYVDKNNNTSLHCASLYGSVECVRLLLEHDADTELTDKNGRTAAEVACTGWGAEQNNRIVIEEIFTHFFLKKNNK